ncbi:polysaccharide deacetylase family protein [Kurthia sibirica]|nr:polysaccharide deacetylase family protein [Kurthia sibirica]GEK33600.1 hypothetical protein KSI01_11330 [Kurthia sibirica]
MDKKGGFVISLDFELGWGVQDTNRDGSYDGNLHAVHTVVPRLLELFSKYAIHVTWATVGMLCVTSKTDLIQYLPCEKPTYSNTVFSSYEIMPSIQDKDPRYFAASLVELIKNTANQEFATHTFSHYYCVEDGQTKEQFISDLKSAKKIAQQPLKSIVFPRNQVNKDYLSICQKEGIRAYRGNPKHPLFKSEQFLDGWHFKRIYKIADSYLNLTGHHTFSLQQIEKNHIWNIQASAFLRPYYSRLKILENLKLKRIVKSLQYAAKNGEIYHLWWHPHNMGKNIDENFEFLEKVLVEFTKNKEKYNFQSYSMSDVVKNLEINN